MTRVLVTGATGFVGEVLCEALCRAGYAVRAAIRTNRLAAGSMDTVIVGDIGSATNWTDALRGVDLVVHLAARVHIAGDVAGNSDLYMDTNFWGTRQLARESVRSGVRRFIYLSSAKVNGEGGDDRPYTAFDKPCPKDAYGKSKWMAEECLVDIAQGTAMEAVIIRAPLVYGPGVRANFLRLMTWVDAGRPMPLAAVTNQRSLVSIWNLCDLLVRVLDSPLAAGRTWMVSDGQDVSTPDLIRRIGAAMHRRVNLWSVPVGALRWGGALVGQGEAIARLCESLTVDTTRTCQDLRWSPPVTLEEALARTVHWYLRKEGRRAV